MCYEIDGLGVAYGPPLAGWGKGQTREVVVDPRADIAHGFEGTQLKTKEGKTIHELLIHDGNPSIIVSIGGVAQMISKRKIQSQKKLRRSLMTSAAQLGLTAREAAYLQPNRSQERHQKSRI